VWQRLFTNRPGLLVRTGHFVVFFWLNYFYFLRFAWYHLEQKVVPLRHQS